MSNSGFHNIQDYLGLSSSETVGFILAVLCGVTMLIILILVFSLACRHWYHRHSNRERLNTSNVAPGKVGSSPSLRKRSHLQDLEEHTSSDTSSGLSQSAVDDSTLTSHQNGGVKQAPPTMVEIADVLRPLLQFRQVPRDDLMLLVMLGEGEYGPVYRAEAHGLGPNNEPIPVIVKTLAIHEEIASYTLFEQDIEMLSSINHLNVVELLAVCINDSPKCILLEAGQPGDLLNHIRAKRKGLSCDAGEPEHLELLRIADEICIGMAYLASERFVHKDLALRNCSIGFDGVVKIAHLGLGPLLYPEAYYRVDESDLPIRWMSLEALTDARFTNMSDVWSFGVTLWEIFTYGDLPFSEKSNEEVLEHLLNQGGKLLKPTMCSDNVFDLVLRCWASDPHSRPFFLEIHDSLAELALIFSSLSILDMASSVSSSSPMTHSRIGSDGACISSTFQSTPPTPTCKV